jgi:resuscitation-promoting factor RpfB
MVAVVAVAVTSYLIAPGSNSAGAALSVIPGSRAFAELEAYRQQLIAMDEATQTLDVATKPQVVTPGQIASSPSTTSSGGLTSVPLAPPNPSAAQQIAIAMMPSFGFAAPGPQYNCLYALWNQESSWSYDAENPSGAYGIPQALPGSKMASAGADWQTNPATQIRWGLGYIKGQYGTPCGAWAFEEANGYY